MHWKSVHNDDDDDFEDDECTEIQRDEYLLYIGVGVTSRSANIRPDVFANSSPIHE